MDGRAAGTATDELRETAALLMAVTERVRGALEGEAAQLGLTAVQARALLALAAPAPMRSLADVLHCDASNVTGLADRLEARGLLARTAAEGDRRVKVLALTPAGHDVRAALAHAVVTGSPVRAALDEGQRAQLVALLRAVADAPDPTPDGTAPDGAAPDGAAPHRGRSRPAGTTSTTSRRSPAGVVTR